MKQEFIFGSQNSVEMGDPVLVGWLYHPNPGIPFLGSRNASVLLVSQPAGEGKGSKECLRISVSRSIIQKRQMAVLHDKGGWEILSLCSHVFSYNFISIAEWRIVIERASIFLHGMWGLSKYVSVGPLSISAIWLKMYNKIQYAE